MRNLGQSRLRIGRAHLNGSFYHVTSVTKNRAPIFADFHLARLLILCLRNSDISLNTETHCFCVKVPTQPDPVCAALRNRRSWGIKSGVFGISLSTQKYNLKLRISKRK